MENKNKYRLRVDYGEIEMPTKSFDFSISQGNSLVDCYEPNLVENKEKVLYATLETELSPEKTLEVIRKSYTYFSLVFGNTWISVSKMNIEIQFEEGGDYEIVESPFW